MASSVAASPSFLVHRIAANSHAGYQGTWNEGRLHDCALSRSRSAFLGSDFARVSFGERQQACSRTPSGARAGGFDLGQLLGGRGLGAGEVSLKTKKGEDTLFKDPSKDKPQPAKPERASDLDESFAKATFDKELGGLTGGFPGGEAGLKAFVVKHPPSKNAKLSKELQKIEERFGKPGVTKATPAPPPLLMPGMTAIVTNKNSMFYNYCGTVQRVTDGRVGLFLEGGNWDKLLTFNLEDVERTKTGPPMSNPKSKILEMNEQ